MKKTSKRTAASRKRSRRRRRTPRQTRPPLESALAAFAELADRLDVRWYVFGAQAVNLHGFPRATADLDLTIDLGERAVSVFVSELVTAGFDPRFTDEAFISATRVIPVVHRDSMLPIDLVLAGPGLEQQFLDEVELRSLGRYAIPVLSAENLVVTKLLAGRPRDLEDVRELIVRKGRALDDTRIEHTLAILEEALGQSDLRPLYARLQAETARRR